MYTEPIQKHLVLPVERFTNKLVSQRYNPFYYHGALPNFFIWVLFLTGLLLFAYYTPTLEMAYPTVNYITYEIPFGNLMRTMHRYAADGMMIFVLLHLFRVWFTDRFREYRILPWITGVILLAITFTVGLTGYMLIWDQDAVTLTYATFNLLHKLPFMGPWLAELWMGGKLITDYTLTRTLFLHLGIPALMMFMLWMHYIRITRPVTNAPLPIVAILLGALFMIAGAFPVDLGQAPVLTAMSKVVELDLWYAWPQYLLFNGWSSGIIWILTLSVPIVLLTLPYLQKKGLRSQYAHVVLENCTGCSLCYHDCPYEAITMVDRPPGDTSKFKRLATVDPGRCANCGLCVGACAFKAIDIPRCESQDVIAEINAALQSA